MNRFFTKSASLILLGVFLTMIVFTDFHRHKLVTPAVDCSLCEHNLPHPLHLSQGYSYQTICLLCQFASTDYNRPQSLNICTIDGIISSVQTRYIANNTSKLCIFFSCRAPPIV